MSEINESKKKDGDILKDNGDQINEYQIKIFKLKAELDALKDTNKSKINQLQYEITELKIQITESNKKLNESIELSKWKSSIDMEISKIYSYLKNKKLNPDEIDQLNEELNRLKEKSDELGIPYEESLHKAAISELIETRERILYLEDELNKANTFINDINQDNQLLQRSLKLNAHHHKITIKNLLEQYQESLNKLQQEIQISNTKNQVHNDESIIQIEQLKKRIIELESELKELNTLHLTLIPNPNRIDEEYNKEIQDAINKTNEKRINLNTNLEFFNQRLHDIETQNRKIVLTNINALEELFHNIYPNRQLYSITSKEDLLIQIIETFLETSDDLISPIYQRIFILATRAFRRGILPDYINVFKMIISLIRNDPKLNNHTIEEIQNLFNQIIININKAKPINEKGMTELYNMILRACERGNEYNIETLPKKRQKRDKE